MSDLKKLQKEITNILSEFIKEEVKNPPEDLMIALKEIAALGTKAVQKNHAGLTDELADQVAIILEIYRLRLNKKSKKTFYLILKSILRTAAALLQ
ncbi:MAG: hypothetical protein DRG33_06020 [Deltaproteobacteria bacterium]|nr:MAG: hypothetical protein DRG33_06020 [Deltaproteobacteria bacterium]